MSTTKVFRAFVIMPFDPEFDSIYEQLIKPSLEEIGYEVVRADSITDQQNILRDIVEGIAYADLVVAELTTLNANVYYELGLCHGLRIPTVLLAQSMDEVPFDLRSYRVQVYETRFDKIHKLKESLKVIAEKHKRGGVTFGSPVIDFYPQRIETKTVAAVGADGDGADGEPNEENESEEEDEKGGADYAAEVEIAFEDMNSFVTELGEINAEYTSRISGHAEQLKKLNENPQPGAARKKRTILSRAASDLNEWSKKLEQKSPDFDKSVESLDESFTGLVRFAEEPSTEEDKLGYANARKTFSEFVPKSHEATESFRELNAVVAGLRSLSKDMSRASRRFTQVLGDIIQTLEKVEAFAGRAVSLLGSKIGDDDTESSEANN
jgi:hypothetical protein